MMKPTDKLTESELQVILDLQANVALALRMKDDISAKLVRHSTGLEVAMELLRIKYSAEGFDVTNKGEWVKKA
ncbi:MAG: hypothetical protein A2W33_04415 [Chloroflexi bacterium RBG_16_52_11]|nr:MAG: hypothetical protein A2W33_04415 [Chloroflexi bacterium RBG_16_52_11]